MNESISKQLLKKATEQGAISLPYLQLAVRKENEEGKMVVVGTGKHRVKFISDKTIKGTDYRTKIERPEVEYIFEENGQKKRYSVPVKNEEGKLHYLIERMADVNYGEEITLEYQRKGVKGFIDVERVIDQGDIKDEDIPIIEENEESKKVVPTMENGDVSAEEEFGPEIPGTDTNEEVNVDKIPF